MTRVPLTVTYPYNTDPPRFVSDSVKYDLANPTDGDVVSNEGDIIVDDSDPDNSNIEYALVEPVDPAFEIGTRFNDGSVKLVYKSGIDADSVRRVVVQVHLLL